MLDMNIKTKVLTALVLLCVVDMVIPVPILGGILVYVVVRRPAWFEQAVRDVYGT